MEDIQTRYQKELGYFRENIAYIDRLLEEIKAKKIQIAEEQIKYIELCEQLKVEYTSHPLPSELLLTETMIYIVSKKPEYIFLFPREKLTYEVCYEAIKNSKERMGAKVRIIPQKFLDYDLCLLIVTLSPQTIRSLPVKMVTQEFVDDLKLKGVNLKKQKSYIEECFKINAKSTNELTSNTTVNDTVSSNYTHLKTPIDEFSNLLTLSIVKTLESKNITTLEELFITYDTGSFGSILDHKNGTYEKVMNTTKMLKCKYCGIDPQVEEQEEDVGKFLKDIGASHRIVTSILRWNTYDKVNPKITTTRLIELVKNGQAEVEINKVRNLGQQNIQELIELIKILIDYKDSQKTKTPIEDKDNLINLQEELNRLLAERTRIENEINNVLMRIQNKTFDESKGGVLK